MSSGSSVQLTAASGGHDWLFADPYAYQYSQISDHVRDLESRSIHRTAGSAICELEGSLPSLAEHGAETSECFELDGGLPPVGAPHICTTSPPSPATPGVAELGAENYVSSPATYQQHPHVANYVKHGEISRGRYANVRLSHKYPLAHRKATVESIASTGSNHDISEMQNALSPVVRSPANPLPRPANPMATHMRRLVLIRTDMHRDQGLVPAEGTSSTPKDFDTILKDIVQPKKEGTWKRISRVIL